jgi:chromosome partitioning protein
VRLSEAPSHGNPAILYDATSVGARAYQQHAQELLDHWSRAPGARPEGETR